MTQPFTMHVETDQVRQHPYHLGTDLVIAETFVYDELRKPNVKSVAIRQMSANGLRNVLIRTYDWRDLPESDG